MNGKKLYKSRDNRMISGVCAGIAGSGVLGYIIAAIVIPEYPMD